MNMMSNSSDWAERQRRWLRRQARAIAIEEVLSKSLPDLIVLPEDVDGLDGAAHSIYKQYRQACVEELGSDMLAAMTAVGERLHWFLVLRGLHRTRMFMEGGVWPPSAENGLLSAQISAQDLERIKQATVKAASGPEGYASMHNLAYVFDEQFSGRPQALRSLISQLAPHIELPAGDLRMELAVLTGLALYWLSQVARAPRSQALNLLAWAMSSMSIVEWTVGWTKGFRRGKQMGAGSQEERQQRASAALVEGRRRGYAARRELYAKAREWAWQRWQAEKHAYDDKPSNASSVFVRLIAAQFQKRDGEPLVVADRTLREVWLVTPPG